jgi:integrase
MAAITTRKLEALKSPGRHHADDGLYLVVSDTGRKAWLFRNQLDGRRRDMGLGAFPAVGLATARIEAAKARALVVQGMDPIDCRKTERRVAQPVPTFEEIAERALANIERLSTNEKVKYRARLLLGARYCATLLKRQMNEITAADLAKLLNSTRAQKPETARKLYAALRRVFEVARVVLRDQHGIALTVPTNLQDLKALGFEPRVRNRPHPAMNWREVPAFMRALRARQGGAVRALEFAILTASRLGEVAGARWCEIDLSDRVWAVPIERAKDRRTRKQPHRVPLSDRAMKILQAQHDLGECWIFPGMALGSHVAPQSMLEALKSMNEAEDGRPVWTDPDSGRTVVAHGFRASFRTWGACGALRDQANSQRRQHGRCSVDSIPDQGRQGHFHRTAPSRPVPGTANVHFGSKAVIQSSPPKSAVCLDSKSVFGSCWCSRSVGQIFFQNETQ